MDALAESSDMSMAYINRTIERLEQRRQALLERQSCQRTKPASNLRRLRFSSLSFEEKKVVATQFIKEIRLSGDEAKVVWNI